MLTVNARTVPQESALVLATLIACDTASSLGFDIALEERPAHAFSTEFSEFVLALTLSDPSRADRNGSASGEELFILRLARNLGPAFSVFHPFRGDPRLGVFLHVDRPDIAAGVPSGDS